MSARLLYVLRPEERERERVEPGVRQQNFNVRTECLPRLA
jgi:hypothetical protein